MTALKAKTRAAVLQIAEWQLGVVEMPINSNKVKYNTAYYGREVSGGIGPMDGEERAWRERHGTFMQELARRADHVTRVFCGLTEGLK